MTGQPPTPTPPLKGTGLTSRNTSARLNSPPLQGRGRGWGLAAGRNAELSRFAQEMRRNPTEPEKRLWRALSGARLSGYKFRRQAVIGPFIADFLRPQRALVVEVDGQTHDVDADRPRDSALQRMGYTVVHVTNRDVMNQIDGVCTAILGALETAPARWASPHPNASPEGEGLESIL